MNKWIKALIIFLVVVGAAYLISGVINAFAVGHYPFKRTPFFPWMSVLQGAIVGGWCWVTAAALYLFAKLTKSIIATNGIRIACAKKELSDN